MARYFIIPVTVFLKILLCNSVHAGKPNFIIILTDDQGWADFSANDVNGRLKTPNLDRLVQSGVNFTNGYTSAPQCIPARVGLLLGKAQNRIGIERNGDSLTPFSQEANLAGLLSENGYTCAMIGKWHLGPGNEIQNHGFGFFYNQVASKRIVTFPTEVHLRKIKAELVHSEPSSYLRIIRGYVFF